MRLKQLIPMLNVSNIETSLDFYRRALGFDIVSPEEAVQEWKWCVIRSGETNLMLSETDCELNLPKDVDPHANVSWPSVFYFYPDDVSELHVHVTAEGFTATDVEVTFYGMKEFSMQDPDGHMLSFGEDADAVSESDA